MRPRRLLHETSISINALTSKALRNDPAERISTAVLHTYGLTVPDAVTSFFREILSSKAQR